MTYTVTVTLKNGQTRTVTGVTPAQLDAWSALSQWTDKTVAMIQCDLDQ